MAKHKETIFLNDKPLTWDEFVHEIRTLFHEEIGRKRAIAKKAGLTYRWTIDFDRGLYKDPTADKVFRLARALGVSFGIVVKDIKVAGIRRRIEART